MPSAFPSRPNRRLEALALEGVGDCLGGFGISAVRLLGIEFCNYGSRGPNAETPNPEPQSLQHTNVGT